MPAFDHDPMSGSADILHYFIKEAIEAQNPSGNPRQYAFGNINAYYHEDGIRTLDQAFTAGAVVQGAAIVEGPPFANGVGTKKLLVSFGAAPGLTAETTRLRTLTTDTAAWTAAVPTSTATAATMFKIITLGDGSMIAATGSGQSTTNIGRTTLGEYMVAKCPRGSDPTLAASWGNVQAVGTPEWPIIDLAPFRDTFAVAKGDGCYVWDDRTKRFRNMLDRVKFLPHALNGKGMAAGENGVWYPMSDGRLFFFDGTTMREETPFKGISLPRDVLQSRASAIADRGDVVAVRMEAFYNTVSPPRAATSLGMKVILVKGSTATDITTLVTNGKLSDGGLIGGIGAAGSKLYIGMNQPFEGAVLNVTRLPNAAVNSFTTPEYSNGAAGWPSLGTVVDFTILGTAGISCALTGFPPVASSSLLSWTSPQAYDLMALETVAFGGSVGNIGPLYWARWSFTNTTLFTSTTEIDEVSPIASRDGLPNTGLLTSATNFTHRSNANCTGKIVIGRRTAQGIKWNDEYELNDFGGVWAMAWTTARTGAVSNGGQALLSWGRAKQEVISESVTRDPSRTLYPLLFKDATKGPLPRLALRRLRVGDAAFRKKLLAVSIEGEFIQPDDVMSVYAWWDNASNLAVQLDTVYGNPAVVKPPPDFGESGRELNIDIVFSDTSQLDATAPYITSVIVDVEDDGGALDWDKDGALPLVSR